MCERLWDYERSHKTGAGKGLIGDCPEWRFLNKMGKPRMLISESKMHISETKDALRNRHS